MQHVSSLATVSPAARKAAALAAYDAAICAPAAADWQAVAHILRAAIPGERRRVDGASTAGHPTWWADYRLPKVYSLDTLAVRFADGVTVRCNIAKAPGKLPRIAAAWRTAIAFYRARTGNDAVPSMVRIESASDATESDAEACSRLTADLRAIQRPEPRPVITPERLAWLTAEVERRRRGLTEAQTDCAELRADPERGALPIYQGKHVVATLLQRAEQQVAQWQASVNAGLDELRQRSAAAGAQADREATAALDVVEAEDAAAEDLGEAMLADEAAADEATLTPAATIEAAGVNVADDSTERAAWIEAAYDRTVRPILDAGTLDAAENENTAVGLPNDPPAADAPEPRETHAIIAVCTSHRARETLFGRLQDGCFPAYSHQSAKCGAYRITYQDAREIGAIRGVRFVGMPRKSITRPAQPVRVPAAVQAAPVACRALASRLCGSAAYHAAAL